MATIFHSTTNHYKPSLKKIKIIRKHPTAGEERGENSIFPILLPTQKFNLFHASKWKKKKKSKRKTKKNSRTVTEQYITILQMEKKEKKFKIQSFLQSYCPLKSSIISHKRK